MEKAEKRTARELVGTVVSDKMNKTIVVRVSRLTVQPVFKKRVRQLNKFKVHDEKNLAKTGDLVKIQGTRPLSRDKRWRLLKVLQKAENR